MRFYGGIQAKGDKSVITLNPFPDQEEPYSGWISWEFVNSNVRYIGQAVYYDISDHLWKLACANSRSTMPCRGILCNNTPNNNGEYPILRFGSLYTDRYNFRNQSLFVDSKTPGKITDIQPSSVGDYVQIIGFSKDYRIGVYDFCPIMVEVG